MQLNLIPSPLKRACLTIVLTLTAGLALAANPSSQSVESLMELSGINKVILEFPDTLKGGIAEGAQSGELPADLSAHFTSYVDSGFDVGQVKDGLKRSLSTSLSANETDELLSWYTSERGRRVTAEENKATTPEAQQEMMASAQTLLQNADRVQKAQRINEATALLDTFIETQKQVSLGMFTLISRNFEPNIEPDVAAFKAQLAQFEPQMRQQMEQFVILALVYTYRDLDDATLDAYLAFLEKPTTRKFNRVSLEHLFRNFEAVMMDWATNVAAMQ